MAYTKDMELKSITEPNHFATPTEKESDTFGLNYAKWMWREGGNSEGVGILLGSRAALFYKNYLYRNAIQETSKYRSLYDIKIDGFPQDASVLNLNWNIVSPIKAYCDIIQNSFLKRGYRLGVNSIDPQSENKKRQHLYLAKSTLKTQNEGIFAGLEEMMGGNIPSKYDQMFHGMEEDQLEIYMKTKYKLPTEIAMEEGIAMVFGTNHMEEVYAQIIDDIITYGTAGTKEWVNENGKVKIRRVNPMYSIVDFTNDPLHRDIRHAGEVVPMTLDALRQEAGDSFSPDEWKDIAKRSMNLSIPGTGQSWSGSGRRGVYPVLDFAFYTTNKDVRRKYTTSTGKERYEEVGYDYKPKAKESISEMPYTVYYEGKWIVGTDYIYNYGLGNYMARPRNTARLCETTLPFHFYSPGLAEGTNKSAVEQMTPFADEYQILWLRYQTLFMAAAPPGFNVDIAALMNIPMGNGKSFQPLDLIKLKSITGRGLYNSLSLSGQPMHNQKPFEMDNGGLPGELIGVLNQMTDLEARMKRIVGLTDAATTTTEERTAAHNVQVQLNVTDNATYHILRGARTILEETGKAVIGRLQSLARTGNKIEGYVEGLGEANVKYIELSADISVDEFAMTVEFEPDDAQKQAMEANIQQALAQRATTGKGGIDIVDAMELRHNPNQKQASLLLANKIEKRRQKDRQEDIENQKMNAQFQAQSAEQAEAARVQSEQQLIGLKLQYEQAKAQIDLQKIQAQESIKAQFRLKELEFTSNSKLLLADNQEEAQKELAQMQADLMKSIAETERISKERISRLDREMDATIEMMKLKSNAEVKKYEVDNRPKPQKVVQTKKK